MIFWSCTICHTRVRLDGEQDFPVTCCGKMHEYPEGVIKPPSVFRLAGNFTRDVIKHTFAGGGLVDNYTREWRLSQCTSCVEYYNPDLQTCTHPMCGCGMKKERGIIDALGWASKRCPIGRWDNPPLRFVTVADLATDTLRLAQVLGDKVA